MTKNKGGEKRATPKKSKTKKLTASELIEMYHEGILRPESLKNVQLKALLKEGKLPISGNKFQLTERLPLLIGNSITDCEEAEYIYQNNSLGMDSEIRRQAIKFLIKKGCVPEKELLAPFGKFHPFLSPNVFTVAVKNMVKNKEEYHEKYILELYRFYHSLSPESNDERAHEDWIYGNDSSKYNLLTDELTKIDDYKYLPEILDTQAKNSIYAISLSIQSVQWSYYLAQRDGKKTYVDDNPPAKFTDYWNTFGLDSDAIPVLIDYLKKTRSINEEETPRMVFALWIIGKICNENKVPADYLEMAENFLPELIRQKNVVLDSILEKPAGKSMGDNAEDNLRILNDTAILALQLISGAEKMHKEAVTENMDTWISNLQSRNSKSVREDAISNLKKVGGEKAINALNEALLREAQALSSITDSFERYQFGRKESLYTHILHVLKEITDPSSLKPIQDCLSILSNDLGQLDAMSTASALKKFKKGGTKLLIKGLTSDNEVYQAQCLASLVEVKKPIKEKRKIVRTELDKLDFDNYRKITHRVLGYGFKHADFIGSIYKMKGKDHAIRMLRDALLGFKEGDYFHQWLDGHNNEDFHILNNASHQLTLIGSNQALGILKQAKSKVKDKELKRIISEYINDFGKKHVPEDDDEFGDEEFDMMPL